MYGMTALRKGYCKCYASGHKVFIQYYLLDEFVKMSKINRSKYCINGNLPIFFQETLGLELILL